MAACVKQWGAPLSCTCPAGSPARPSADAPPTCSFKVLSAATIGCTTRVGAGRAHRFFNPLPALSLAIPLLTFPPTTVHRPRRNRRATSAWLGLGLHLDYTGQILACRNLYVHFYPVQLSYLHLLDRVFAKERCHPLASYNITRLRNQSCLWLFRQHDPRFQRKRRG